MNKVINLAFAGFRHGHIYSLLDCALKNENVHITGGWEDYGPDREIAKQKGMEFPYATYEELLADSIVDAVAIGNYYQARGRMVIDALKAGKHVIVDKPVCISMEELEEIKALCKETGLEMFAMLDMRFHPNVQAAKQLIDKGEIGKVNNISFGGQHPLLMDSRASWYFEDGKHGGTINDIAVHGIDLARYFTGCGVKEINGARTWNHYAAGVSHFMDSGMFMVTLENGAGLMADVSYAVPDSIGFDIPYYWEFKIWGSKGMLTFSYYTDGVMLYQNGKKEAVSYPGVTLPINYLDSFVAAIQGKETCYLSTGDSLQSSEDTLKIQIYADEH